jgi:ABC-type multidrug transport system fused ATPase/permease subunit
VIYPQIPLTSTKVFVSLALFNLLNFPLIMFPSVISSSVEASVAFSRLRTFLSNEELNPDAVTFEPLPYQNGGSPKRGAGVASSVPLVEISKGSFKWASPTSTSGNLILDTIDLQCSTASLVAIVGPVGAGKSSLLSAILGEMTKISGSVVVRGSVAYAAQSPWITNATLRENVLFGLRYDETWYNKVLDACGLRSDLQVLPGGDLVEIGERGINLSGGQKARVGLARAVYANSDVYLL